MDCRHVWQNVFLREIPCNTEMLLVRANSAGGQTLVRMKRTHCAGYAECEGQCQEVERAFADEESTISIKTPL